MPAVNDPLRGAPGQFAAINLQPHRAMARWDAADRFSDIVQRRKMVARDNGTQVANHALSPA